MKILKAILFFSLLFLTQSIFLAQDEICDPDLSIENQREKKIPKQARDLLKKIIKDIKKQKLSSDEVFISWPVEVCKCWVSSLFGPRSTGHHNGVDLAASQKTPVYAAADGVVEIAEKSSDKNGYGNMILISHTGLTFYDEFGYRMNYKTRYAHLDSILVKKDKLVTQGQQIGTVGATGHVIKKHAKADPSHLHFEVYRGKNRINPLIALFASDYAWVQRNLED